MSLFISAILYILVSLAAVALMPSDQLAHSDSALTDAAMKSSAGLAGVLGGIALFSTANTALIGLITTSRILYGISKDGSLPQVLSKTLSNQKTPWVAALVSFTIAALFLPLGKVEVLAGIASFSMMIAFIAVNVSLIVLRKTQSQKNRPFKVPIAIGWIPLVPLFAIGSCLLFLFQFDWEVHLVSLIVFFVSACICLLCRCFNTDQFGRSKQ